jgi:hypothetical protein
MYAIIVPWYKTHLREILMMMEWAMRVIHAHLFTAITVSWTAASSPPFSNSWRKIELNVNRDLWTIAQ